jgi:ribokinase
MSARAFQVYGLGQCCLDYIGLVDAYPPADAKCEVREMVVQGGGPTATALVALARWGVSCTFAGVVGDDPFGPVIRASLDDEGVGTSGLIVRSGSESQFSYIVAHPDTGTRTVFWRRPTGAPPGAHEIDLDLVRHAAVVHLDGLFMEASLAVATEARSAGAAVVVDAGSLRDGMLDLARRSSVFFASQRLAEALVGGDKPLEACRRLAEFGPDLVGVTLGHRGYVALHRGRIIERPAYEVKAVDTTGCGDVFHAALSYGLVSGWAAEKSLDFGAWAAAMVSLEPGGRAGIPPANDFTGADR